MWNLNLTERPVFLFATSSNPTKKVTWSQVNRTLKSTISITTLSVQKMSNIHGLIQTFKKVVLLAIF